jgi:hypothetical protein
VHEQVLWTVPVPAEKSKEIEETLDHLKTKFPGLSEEELVTVALSRTLGILRREF